MTDYTFSTLNDREFEGLVCDLLSSEFQTRVERFKPGKDQGIDGRFYTYKNGTNIIQCKHYLTAGIYALLSHLKTTELKKVKALNPDNYIFCTTLPLSPMDKKKITRALYPYIRRSDNIFGAAEVNNLIDKHQHIERQHFKLWLSSVNILHSILNNHIFGRSQFFKEDILDKSKHYVLTENVNEGIQKLNDNKTLIISGEPGIGKTTIAEIICLHYLRENYNIYHIESIVEAEKVLS